MIMMKYHFLLSFLLISFLSIAQDKLPNIVLKDMNGKSVNLSQLTNNGKPIVINFWATWCGPCKRELEAIHEVYESWVEETGVTLYAVSIDDQRNVDKVKPYANAQQWAFEVLLDTNGDLKRAMGVNNVPFTFLVDGQGKIVWKHNNYNPGDEEELLHKIKELSKQ
jgi:cytochrome c biogenesis protein CcmG/thiol:disulfide interchange protein DsbE